VIDLASQFLLSPFIVAETTGLSSSKEMVISCLSSLNLTASHPSKSAGSPTSAYFLFMADVLEVFGDFGELNLEIFDPAAKALLLLTKPAGSVGHRLGSELGHEYPASHNAATQETVEVFTWRLIDPAPDAALTLQDILNVSGGWCVAQPLVNLIIRKITRQSDRPVVVVVFVHLFSFVSRKS